MKVKLFTHTDLDGLGCAIVAKLGLDDDVDVTYCDYHNVNDLVRDFINSPEVLNYTHIFITDISVKDDLPRHLDTINDADIQVVLIDHHDTNLPLAAEYDWAIVKPTYEDGVKTAGTGLLLHYFNQHYPELLKDVELEVYAEIVRRYDTWDWTRLGDDIPRKYNDLLSIIGRDRFLKKMIPAIRIHGNGIFLTEQDELLLEIRQEEKEKYINEVEKKMFRKEIDGRPVGVVFAERFTSELGNEICKRHSDIDYVLIINTHYETYSLRSVRDDIHVGEISKKLFGGGGHPLAAGAQLSKEQMNYIIDYVTK
jgi:uncharacterized protein